MAYTPITKLNKFTSEEDNAQDAVTNTRDFKAAKLEANYAQAINLVMNGLSELDSKLKQFIDISNTNDAAIIFTSSLSAFSSNLSTTVPTQLSAAVSDKLSASTTSKTATELTSKQNSKTKINTAKLEIIDGSPLTDPHFLVTPEDAPPNNLETNQKQSLTNNISPATVTNNKSLAVIFSFELEETTPVPLFSRVTFDTKPITVMYTDAKVDGHSIKLILDSGLAGSIITKQLIDQLGRQVDCAASTRIITTNKATKTPIGEINDFSIKVNSIIVPIKVLVMKATQYQTLIGASNQPEQTTHMCTSHVWLLYDYQLDSTTHRVRRKKKKPTWEAY
ncbi:hypothetical protein G9A89_016057 [Geosiphon pyriformis]|nr:hypothetical protein G9A89_016057 [Geosiphon pyriformis]